MDKPTRERVLAAERTSRSLGLGLTICGFIWEGINRLGEHIVLSWIADRLQEQVAIVGALKWTVDHPVWFFLLLALVYLAVVCLKAVFSAARLDSEATSGVSAHASGDQNQTLAAGRDIIITSPVPLSSPPKRAIPQVTRPNLQYCGFRDALMYISPWEHGGVREPTNDEQDKEALRAVVLKFENEPLSGGIVADTSDLIARVVYRIRSGATTRIDYAVWINGGLRTHYIEVGETHELLLFLQVKEEGGESRLVVLEDRRVNNHHFSDKFAWFRLETLEAIESAEITLTDQRSQARYIFDLGITERDGAFEVKLLTVTLPLQSNSSPGSPVS